MSNLTVFSTQDANNIISEWIEAPEGMKILNSMLGIYSQGDYQKIAEELKNSIISGFLNGTRHANYEHAKHYFDSVEVTVISGANKTPTARIFFPKKSLYRPSLLTNTDWWRSGQSYTLGGKRATPKSSTSGFTGKGINDIFSLITNGASSKARVYGRWVYSEGGSDMFESDDIVGSWQYRPTNPIIKNIINDFQAKYPYIKVDYPEEWGGNI